jgi:hypothetical protein
MDLRAYLGEQTNVVEFYFCPKGGLETELLQMSCQWETLPRIPTQLFKHRSDQHFTEYTHRHLVHQYDLATDMQKTFTRALTGDRVVGNCYIASFQEDTLPMHRFPCTLDINDTKSFHRVTFKYNNRLSLIIDKEKNRDGYVMYLRYFHVDNIDLDKMNQDINTAFAAVSTSQK